MQDREKKPDLEVKFEALQGELITQIRTTYQEDLQKYKGVVVRVVSNEWDGGSQALLLGSDGKWSGKLDMMGWDIGEKPELDRLITDYAEIKDKDYEAIRFDDGDDADIRSEAYVAQNRERLLQGLISEMERVLGEMRNPEEPQTN